MKSRLFRSLVGWLQWTLARSSLGIFLALKLREQCNSVIGLHCQSGIEPDHNGEAWLAERVAPFAKTVVDVGANLGHWSSMFARYMPGPGRLILIEPNPEAVAILKSIRIGDSSLGIDVLQVAASDSEGIAKFFMESQAGETSSLIESHSSPLAEKISVPIVTLDDVMEDLGVVNIDMLKIDAEGYDLRVLLGARALLESGRIGVVQFEYNAPWAAAGSTLAFAFRLLHDSGLNVYLLKSGGLYRFDSRRFGEYYRYSNFVAIRSDMVEIVLGNMRPLEMS